MVPVALTRDPLYRGYRFPAEIISHAVWLYYRFALSHRDIEDLLAERGIEVSYETVRLWCRTFGPALGARLRRHRRGARGRWLWEGKTLDAKWAARRNNSARNEGGGRAAGSGQRPHPPCTRRIGGLPAPFPAEGRPPGRGARARPSTAIGWRPLSWGPSRRVHRRVSQTDWVLPSHSLSGIALLCML